MKYIETLTELERQAICDRATHYAIAKALRIIDAQAAALARVRELSDMHKRTAAGSVFSTALVEYLDTCLEGVDE